MKSLINKHGNCVKFSKKYGIPLDTVRNWYQGKSKPPEWTEKLLNTCYNQEIHIKRLIGEEEKEKEPISPLLPLEGFAKS
jgi:hypothetical protein